MSIKLYRHQQDALSLLRLYDRYALFAEQGTGKSFPILFRAAELAESKSIKSCLIIAPRAVCEGWEDKICQLSPKQREALDSIKLEVISYDFAWRHKRYEQGAWDMVVVDESHYIKNPATKRTKAVIKICSNAKYAYILTGTPTSNGQLCNIWAQFAAIDPVKVKNRIYPACLGGKSYYKWLDDVAYLNVYYQPYKYRNVHEIQEIINEHSYRITKAECLDLPEKLPDQILWVDIAANARKDYNEMRNNSAIEAFQDIADNPLTRMLRLRQIVSGFYQLEDETWEYACTKIKILQEFLSDFEKKVVIFCEFKHSIDEVEKLLKKLNFNPVVLDGRQRDKGVWRKFQTDDSIRAIICQYESGSAGIDLYAADTCIFYEPTLKSTSNEQAKDRIHRTGQTSPCSYYYMLTRGTIEEAIYQSLQNYADFGVALFNEWIETYEKGQKL